MKSMSKNVCIFLSLMFACTTLSACGSSENSSASENKSTEATSTAITQDATSGQKEGETYIGADYTGSPISIKAAHTGRKILLIRWECLLLKTMWSLTVMENIQ